MLLFCLRAGDENCVSLALPVPPGAMWRLKINVRTGKRHLAEIKLRGLEPPQVFPVGNYMREAETPPQRSTPRPSPNSSPAMSSAERVAGARPGWPPSLRSHFAVMTAEARFPAAA